MCAWSVKKFRGQRRLYYPWYLFPMALLSGCAHTGTVDPALTSSTFDKAREICLDWRPGLDFAYERAEPLVFRGRVSGTRFFIDEADAGMVELEVIGNPETPNRFIATLIDPSENPRLLLSFNGNCDFQVGRQIQYDPAGKPESIIDLDNDLNPSGEPELLNPPWPGSNAAGTTDKRLRVGLIDSGVNYLLPEINARLAVDQQGQLIGYDFWDMDELPFDSHPARSLFFVQRHGTKTASILLDEAPGVELVPYRYPRPDMTRIRALIEHAVANDVRILGMPLGGNKPSEWQTFAEVAAEHPELLFIASAGNNGFDLDQRPIFPASLALDNLLVVTSSDDFVRPAERSNWGQTAVDYLLPAENISAIDFSGEPTRVAGSSYAVSRLLALAARLLQQNPDWNAREIIAELESRYVPVAPRSRRWVSTGFIPDPLADGPLQYSEELQRLELEPAPGLGLSLDVLVLDEGWSDEAVAATLQQTFQILGQCEITPLRGIVRRIDIEERLRDLSIGNAHTLFTTIPGGGLRVVFARDTIMQEQYMGEAFGLGNTAMRPWMSNSAWLVLGVDDPGVALAHELFHVLANDGSHTTASGNLMQGETRPDGTGLTPRQCLSAARSGLQNGLLVDQTN